MLRLSAIFFVIHFCLAYGLRNGFRRTEEIDPKAADEIFRFSEHIEFFLTQPGQSICEFFDWGNGSAGFWAMAVFTSLLWANISAFITRGVFKGIFR